MQVDEAELRRLHDARAFDQVATSALTAFGPEIYGFLVHALGNPDHAGEVFSELGENVWTALPGFGFRCSLRTWLYVLARHAMSRFRRSPWNTSRRASGSVVGDALAHARSQTSPWLRTDVKDRFRALRDELASDDRELLVLRVDRDLPWEDISRVMLGDEAPDDAMLQKECARLRKRYQLVKVELRALARASGLLDEAR